MPKRPREDSPSSGSTSPSATPDSPSPSSTDVHAHSSKYIQTTSGITTVMKCSLPPHGTLEFSTFEEFEIHYSKIHLYRCAECHKNFPTEHFLALHISENHDPLSEARRAKGEKTVRLRCPLHLSVRLNAFSIIALWKVATRFALLPNVDGCISQTSTCSQGQEYLL